MFEKKKKTQGKHSLCNSFMACSASSFKYSIIFIWFWEWASTAIALDLQYRCKPLRETLSRKWLLSVFQLASSIQRSGLGEEDVFFKKRITQIWVRRAADKKKKKKCWVQHSLIFLTDWNEFTFTWISFLKGALSPFFQTSLKSASILSSRRVHYSDIHWMNRRQRFHKYGVISFYTSPY